MLKKIIQSSLLGGLLLTTLAFLPAEKLSSNKTHIRFFSHTPVEDIEAHNYQSISSLHTGTGEVVFSVPMQGFQFEKALMQKHFNQPNFLDSQQHPKAKFVGQITNLTDINFQKDGEYAAAVAGKMTIKGKTHAINDKGMVKVSGKNIILDAKFTLTLADYDVAFEKGKPSSNIAKTIEVTVEAIYTQP